MSLGGEGEPGVLKIEAEAMCQGAPWTSQEWESRSLAGENQSGASSRSDSVLLEGSRVTALSAGQKLAVSVFGWRCTRLW